MANIVFPSSISVCESVIYDTNAMKIHKTLVYVSKTEDGISIMASSLPFQVEFRGTYISLGDDDGLLYETKHKEGSEYSMTDLVKSDKLESSIDFLINKL